MLEGLVQFRPQGLQGQARLQPVRLERTPAHLTVNPLFQIDQRLWHSDSLNRHSPGGNPNIRLGEAGV